MAIQEIHPVVPEAGIVENLPDLRLVDGQNRAAEELVAKKRNHIAEIRTQKLNYAATAIVSAVTLAAGQMLAPRYS
jgi:hypothetical protein